MPARGAATRRPPPGGPVRGSRALTWPARAGLLAALGVVLGGGLVWFLLAGPEAGRRADRAARSAGLTEPDAAASGEEAPEIGRRAPDFTLPDLQGRQVRLADFRGRRAVVLNFWATWCAPCRREMPTLERLARERAAVLVVLGVNLDSGDPAPVRAFIRELGLTFPILLDPERTLLARYRLVGVPTTFVLDRAGVIRYREVGFRDWTSRESRAIVEDVLRRG